MHPVRPLGRERAGLELQLQAEVHPRQPDADLAGQPARRAVRGDDHARPQRPGIGLHDVVRHRQHPARHPHLGARLHGTLEQPGVELGPGDHLQAGLVDGARTPPAARERQRDPGDRRARGWRPGQRGQRRPDQPSAAGLVARERRPVEHDDASAGRRGRPGRGGPGRPGADHRDVVLLHGADASERPANWPDVSRPVTAGGHHRDRVAPWAAVSQTFAPSSTPSVRARVRVMVTSTSEPSSVATRDPHLEADPQDPGDRARRRAERARLHRHVDVVRADGLAGQVGGLAEEAHHEVVRRLVVERVRAADLLHPAVVDDHDLVGDLEGLLLVVGHEDRGGVHLVVQPAQPVAQLLADLRVERAERLVEQQHASAPPRAPGPAPCAGAGRPRAGRASGRGTARGARGRAAPRPACLISSLGRLRISRPKATFLATVMCLKTA